MKAGLHYHSVVPTTPGTGSMSNLVRLGERRAKRMQEEIEIEEENSEEDYEEDNEDNELLKNN